MKYDVELYKLFYFILLVPTTLSINYPQLSDFAPQCSVLVGRENVAACVIGWEALVDTESSIFLKATGDNFDFFDKLEKVDSLSIQNDCSKCLTASGDVPCVGFVWNDVQVVDAATFVVLTDEQFQAVSSPNVTQNVIVKLNINIECAEECEKSRANKVEEVKLSMLALDSSNSIYESLPRVLVTDDERKMEATYAFSLDSTLWRRYRPRCALGSDPDVRSGHCVEAASASSLCDTTGVIVPGGSAQCDNCCERLTEAYTLPSPLEHSASPPVLGFKLASPRQNSVRYDVHLEYIALCGASPCQQSGDTGCESEAFHVCDVDLARCVCADAGRWSVVRSASADQRLCADLIVDGLILRNDGSVDSNGDYCRTCPIAVSRAASVGVGVESGAVCVYDGETATHRCACSPGDAAHPNSTAIGALTCASCERSCHGTTLCAWPALADTARCVERDASACNATCSLIANAYCDESIGECRCANGEEFDGMRCGKPCHGSCSSALGVKCDESSEQCACVDASDQLSTLNVMRPYCSRCASAMCETAAQCAPSVLSPRLCSECDENDHSMRGNFVCASDVCECATGFSLNNAGWCVSNNSDVFGGVNSRCECVSDAVRSPSIFAGECALVPVGSTTSPLSVSTTRLVTTAQTQSIEPTTSGATTTTSDPCQFCAARRAFCVLGNCRCDADHVFDDQGLCVLYIAPDDDDNGDGGGDGGSDDALVQVIIIAAASACVCIFITVAVLVGGAFLFRKLREERRAQRSSAEHSKSDVAMNAARTSRRSRRATSHAKGLTRSATASRRSRRVTQSRGVLAADAAPVVQRTSSRAQVATVVPPGSTRCYDVVPSLPEKDNVTPLRLSTVAAAPAPSVSGIQYESLPSDPHEVVFSAQQPADDELDEAATLEQPPKRAAFI